MRVGVLVQNFGGFPDTGRGARACVDLARHAEGAGYDSVWVTDHIVLPANRATPYPHNDSGSFPYAWHQDIHEPLVLLGALATATERVLLGVSVLVIPYRHPLLTAKMLATVEQLSAGRVVLGAGVGWLREEFDALGLDPSIFVHRGAVTDDYLEVMRAAWTADGAVAHDGRFVRFDAVGTYPHPVQRPLPVWIGGKGPRSLRRTVALGDGYLAISSDPAVLAAEVAELRALEHAAGRAERPATIALIDGIVVTDRALGADRHPLHGTPEQILEGLTAFAGAGLEHLVAGVRPAGDGSFAGALDALDAIAPLLAALRS